MKNSNGLIYLIKIVVLFFTTISLSYSLSAEDNTIILQSTTSTKNSGFIDHISPILKKDSGIVLRVVSVGTGQAIRNGMNCDGDVLLTHSEEDEVKFISLGYGVKRHLLMYNDFIIIGPSRDPAQIETSSNTSQALKNIRESGSLFVSRGDNSGTHKKELKLWSLAGINPQLESGKWYLELGTGQGAMINTAVGLGAYALSDRATWISFKNKQDFKILLENDENLINQYSLILVNKHKCKNVKRELGKTFINWMLSSKGKFSINNFKVNGTRLFFYNAKP